MTTEAPWRCTVCGLVAPPDPMKTQLDPRYAEGYCAVCHHSRSLIRAATVDEATAGYHAMLDVKARQKQEIDERKGVKK